jgi:hypothetical protein
MEEGVRKLEEAVRATTEEAVPLSKPYPQSKRWFTPELKRQKQECAKLQRIAYRHRFKPEHPAHDAARTAEKKYAKSIESEKARHWWEWLANLGQTLRSHRHRGFSITINRSSTQIYECFGLRMSTACPQVKYTYGCLRAVPNGTSASFSHRLTYVFLGRISLIGM